MAQQPIMSHVCQKSICIRCCASKACVASGYGSDAAEKQAKQIHVNMTLTDNSINLSLYTIFMLPPIL